MLIAAGETGNRQERARGIEVQARYFPIDATQLGFGINALGFRGPEIALRKPPGTCRIVCLGDSTTFGIWNEAFMDVPAVKITWAT